MIIPIPFRVVAVITVSESDGMWTSEGVFHKTLPQFFINKPGSANLRIWQIG
jgi:hypothetical protein